MEGDFSGMKKTKKWLAVLLAGSMIMAGGMSVTASAAEAAVSESQGTTTDNVETDCYGKYEFIPTKDGKGAHLVSYLGNSKEEVIYDKIYSSDYVDEYKAKYLGKGLGGYHLFNSDSIYCVDIVGSPLSIETGAFYDCPNLKSLVIRSNTTEIKTKSIVDCPSLVIYGEKGSKAETYANKNNIKFVNIKCTHYYGDVDFDGQITSGDAQAILRASAEQEYFFSDQKKAADVNCDGSILSDDAINVLRYSAGYNVTGTKIGQVIK